MLTTRQSKSAEGKAKQDKDGTEWGGGGGGSEHAMQCNASRQQGVEGNATAGRKKEKEKVKVKEKEKKIFFFFFSRAAKDKRVQEGRRERKRDTLVKSEQSHRPS